MDAALNDTDRVIRYWEYNQGTGAVTKTIEDAVVPHASDFALSPPANWTSMSGEQRLITHIVVDGMGRTTKLTEPDGNVAYTVYRDAHHEVRTYAGWQTSTNTPTGPTVVRGGPRAQSRLHRNAHDERHACAECGQHAERRREHRKPPFFDCARRRTREDWSQRPTYTSAWPA